MAKSKVTLSYFYLTKLAHFEVTKEMTSTNKKNKRKSYKREEVNEWRLAKRARPGAFTSNTNVICLIECEDDDSEQDHEFFIGTIVKEVDGHVKVHLSGLGRSLEQTEPSASGLAGEGKAGLLA